MLQPKKTKYHKFQRRAGGIKMNALSFGSFGFQSLHSELSASVIEAARRAMTTNSNEVGKFGFEFSPIKQ